MSDTYRRRRYAQRAVDDDHRPLGDRQEAGANLIFSGATLFDLGDLLTANKIDVIATVWPANPDRGLRWVRRGVRDGAVLRTVLYPDIGIAVRTGDSELLGKLNTSLAKLMADGTVKAIFAQYGIDWSQPTTN